MKRIDKKFREMVKERLDDKGYTDIEYYYNGYVIRSINYHLPNEATTEDIEITKIAFRELITTRLEDIALSMHKRSRANEYKGLSFGTPMLCKVASSVDFIESWKWLTSYFIGDYKID